ncbi:MAG: SusE domain-containing protein [Bacteroidota bacterium]
MKNKLLIFIALLGMVSFFACEKDETRAILSPNPVAPVIEAVSDMVLARDNATDSIVISGSNADFGYQAAVEYILEAGVAGTEFADPIELGRKELVNWFGFTVSSLNALLIESLPEDVQSSLELRVRAVIISSTTGGSEQIESASEVLSVKITTYGFPRLDVNIEGVTETQKIISKDGDGKYVGFVKFDAGDVFTMTDPDAGKTYGGGGAIISEGGSAITVADAGWYKLEADINGLTMNNGKYLVGIVGVVNGWAAPDLVMEYDIEGKFWYKYGVVLPDGGMKFRHNEDWGNDFNLGVLDNTNPDLTNLRNEGGSQDIIMTAGTYDIKLWIANVNGVVPEYGSSCTIEKVE